MTFYRKYRPQKIEELDNEEIRQRLFAVLSSASLPHAFLFSGPKGAGKTSAARIVAKAINCEKKLKVKSEKLKVAGERIEPCNQCSICQAITNGTSLDVLEIDAASNRGIDEIRDLREKIKLAPSTCRYKVYIIDEVHMLTNEAFNALLKTLEEPPEHAVFILCTTEPRKLPETITSRCLRFNFKRAKTAELLRSLKRIVDGEKIKIDEPALVEIAKNSDGSFREAAKILEELSFENKEITKDLVLSFLGKTKVNKADELLKFLVLKDTKGAILWINKALENGADLKIITTDLLEILRNYLIKKTAGIENEEVEYGEPYEKLTLEEIKRLIEIFSQAYFELKSAIIPQLPLELAVVEWSGEKQEEPHFSPFALSKGQDSGRISLGVRKEKKEKEREDNSASPSVRKSTKNEPVDFDKIVSLWPEILEGIKPLNHSVHAVLKGARPLAVEDNVLIIEAFYKFHKERLEEPKVNSLLTKVFCDKLGCEIGIKCILGERKTKDQEPKNKDGESEGNKSESAKTEEITDDDLIKAAEEIFK